MFVSPLLAFQLTGSAFVAAMAETAHLLGLAVALLPAGVLADRFDRRRLMRLASASGVLLYVSLVIAALSGALTLSHLLAVAVLTGAGAGLFAPAEFSAVRTVVSTDELPTALSQHQARQHVASLVGAPIGALLYAVSRWLPFAVDAVSYAVTWFMLGRIRTDLSAAKVQGSHQRPRQEVCGGHQVHPAPPLPPGARGVGGPQQPRGERPLLHRRAAPDPGRVPTAADRAGRDSRGRLRRGRRHGRAQHHRPVRHRTPDHRRRVEPDPARGADGTRQRPGRRGCRARDRAVPQPRRQRRDRRLPDRRDAGRAAGPDPVDEPVPVDVGAPRGPAAGRVPARPPRWGRGRRRAGTSSRPWSR